MASPVLTDVDVDSFVYGNAFSDESPNGLSSDSYRRFLQSFDDAQAGRQRPRARLQ